MSRPPGPPVGRGAALVGLAIVLATITVLTTGLSWLRPPMQDVTVPPTPVGLSCDQPGSRARPSPVASSTLLSCPHIFDGRTIVVEGEAIGDLLRGPDGRHWVQINDDAYSRVGALPGHWRALGTNSGIAVLLPQGQRPAALGRHGVQGDVLRITGVFLAAAPEDQGGPAVIAQVVDVRRPGGPVSTVPSHRLRVAAPIAVLVTAMLGLAVWRRRVALG